MAITVVGQKKKEKKITRVVDVPIAGSEISDPWANLEKSFSLQILIEGPRVRCFQQISTILSLGNSYYNGKSGF